MWFMAAVGVISAIAGFMGQSSAAKAQQIVAKANADAENMVRKGRNEYETSVAALNNTIRSVRNKQIMEAAGSQHGALAQNIVRLEDEVVRGKLESRIASAEALGELSAASSAMGIGGSAVDVIENTMMLQEARSSQQYQQNANYRSWDLQQQKAGTIANAIRSLDSGQDMASQDFSVSQAPYIPKPSFFSAALQGISNAAPYVAASWGGKGGEGGQGGGGAHYLSSGFGGGVKMSDGFFSSFKSGGGSSSGFSAFTLLDGG